VSKPASYPFLAIANKYGLDYGEVLRVAQCAKTRAPFTKDLAHWVTRAVAITAIGRATDEQQAIREGRIDWQTGEPL
jgi:hypothetical protein